MKQGPSCMVMAQTQEASVTYRTQQESLQKLIRQHSEEHWHPAEIRVNAGGQRTQGYPNPNGISQTPAGRQVDPP
ncbi:hypothetical protein ILYODFUR_007328 [Ilyodon furcidens]|uniref:Uncharacterized protein n=1 Tax=Ilyodon furcidens TaxID=33524 RepID=A0ABV0VCI5_9TELE